MGAGGTSFEAAGPANFAGGTSSAAFGAASAQAISNNSAGADIAIRIAKCTAETTARIFGLFVSIRNFSPSQISKTSVAPSLTIVTQSGCVMVKQKYGAR